MLPVARGRNQSADELLPHRLGTDRAWDRRKRSAHVLSKSGATDCEGLVPFDRRETRPLDLGGVLLANCRSQIDRTPREKAEQVEGLGLKNTNP